MGGKSLRALPIRSAVSAAVIGIDLGTANSCVAVVQDGRAVVLSDGTNRTVPSCVAFADGMEIVGHMARRQMVTDPHTTVVSVKRLMGHPFGSPEVEAARSRAPYPIKQGDGGSVILEVGGRQLTPVEISTRVLGRIKEGAAAALGHEVTRAVISVPAHFNDVQRKATKLAAEQAGLDVIRLINEPTAAAFAYGYLKGEDFTLAVYDLGGGTFDIAIMTARGDAFEVIATDGNSYLGGEDFDYAVAEWLREEFKEEFGHDLKDDETALLRLKEAAERAKVELSETAESRLDLPFLTQLPDGSRPNFTRVLTRAKITELVMPLVQRTLELCGRCLEDAKVGAAALDEVLLVGGQTRMPVVRDSVRKFFNKEPRRDINPDEAVAMGAALYAYSFCADSLREEAEEAAEDAFAVARKGTDVARKMLEGIGRLGGEVRDLPGLRDRINALLGEAGDDDAPTPKSVAMLESPETSFDLSGERALPGLREASEDDLPTASSLPTRRRATDADLPQALSELRGELTDLSEKAQQAIGRLAEEVLREEPGAGGPDTIAKGVEQLSQQLSAQVSERLESAREKSEEVAGLLQQADEHAQARRVELIDITSLALGIASVSDLFTVLIEHNSPVPTEKKRVFTTNQENQSEVHIRVRQGRALKASQNQLLGEFVLEGIEPAPRMEPKIEVTFAIDENGILSVSARDQGTDREQLIRVEDPLGLQQATREDLEKLAEAEEAQP